MRKYIRKSIFFILLLPILTSCATGPKNYYLVPTGYKTLDMKYWLQDDGFNKIFIMEESQKKSNQRWKMTKLLRTIFMYHQF